MDIFVRAGKERECMAENNLAQKNNSNSKTNPQQNLNLTSKTNQLAVACQ
jgi:hypothetical protein